MTMVMHQRLAAAVPVAIRPGDHRAQGTHQKAHGERGERFQQPRERVAARKKGAGQRGCHESIDDKIVDLEHLSHRAGENGAAKNRAIYDDGFGGRRRGVHTHNGIPVAGVRRDGLAAHTLPSWSHCRGRCGMGVMVREFFLELQLQETGDRRARVRRRSFARSLPEYRDELDDQDYDHHQFEDEAARFTEFIDHELVEFAGSSQFLIHQAAVIAGADLDGGQAIGSSVVHVAQKLDGIVGAFGQLGHIQPEPV